MSAQEKSVKPGKGWVTKKALADFLDVTPRCFDQNYRRYLDAESQKLVGNTLWFKARAFLDRWKETGGRGNHGPAAIPGEADPNLVGPVTDALEFYRKQKGLQEEIKLKEMQGAFVALNDLEPQLLALCGAVRRANEAVIRKYGNDAGQMLNEALDELENGVDGILEPAGAKGVSDDRADS